MGPPKDSHGGGGYEIGLDIRLDFIYEYVLRSLKIKMDKWQKMLNQEEFRNILNDFFDKPEKKVSVINRGKLRIFSSNHNSCVCQCFSRLWF